MRRIRRAGAALSTLVVLGAVTGRAASLGGDTEALGASTAAVARCDTDGVTVLQNLSGANVISVAVGSIASTCGTAPISVTLHNGTTFSTGTGTVPAGGGSVTITLGTPIAARDAERTDISITGP